MVWRRKARRRSLGGMEVIGLVAVTFAIVGFVAWLYTREKYTGLQQLLWLALVYFVPIIGPTIFIWRQWADRP